MVFQINQKFIVAILISAFAVFGLACQSQKAPEPAPKPTTKGEGGTSPIDAYKKLYAAVKSKQTEAIRDVLSEKTIGFAQFASERQNQPFEKVLENGFTMTTFSETLPEMRDERVKGDSGALEVWNSKESRWEDLPFIKEDGSWRLAIGDLFSGSFESPGKGMAQIESEASNQMNKMVPITPKGVSNSAISKQPNLAGPNAKTSTEKK